MCLFKFSNLNFLQCRNRNTPCRHSCILCMKSHLHMHTCSHVKHLHTCSHVTHLHTCSHVTHLHTCSHVNHLNTCQTQALIGSRHMLHTCTLHSMYLHSKHPNVLPLHTRTCSHNLHMHIHMFSTYNKTCLHSTYSLHTPTHWCSQSTYNQICSHSKHPHPGSHSTHPYMITLHTVHSLQPPICAPTSHIHTYSHSTHPYVITLHSVQPPICAPTPHIHTYSHCTCTTTRTCIHNFN